MKTTYIKKSLAVVVILLFVSVSVIPSTGTIIEKKSTIPTFYDGNILYVGGSGTGNYSRIQDAIDNASDGDTVFVYNGEYNEHLHINKQLSLIGESRYNTYIVSNDPGDMLVINADWVIVKEFTMDTRKPTHPKCNGILSYGNHTTIIDNVFIRNKRAIHLINSYKNYISNNNITTNYDNIFLERSNNNTLTNNSFDNNRYHAFELIDSHNNYISNNTINDTQGDGTISLSSSTNNIVINN
ncbi:MAG: right-handed parallel beta-helix repeat-containing protein, partial [Thermoplasmatales archaeon]